MSGRPRISIKCPKCSHRFPFPEGEETHVRCPQCSIKLRVRLPDADGDPAVTESSASSGKGSSSAHLRPVQNRAVEDPLAPGTRLGGFEIRNVVGRGGMAIVYAARQLSLQRDVAVKVLNARWAANPTFVKRFDAEAGALATLQHPNIVNIIDKGHEGQHYYFVMEYVDGMTLDQLLNATSLTPRHYAHITSEISRALTYVHSRGVIHRDIKPSNILIMRQGHVKVGDFGIAHIMEDSPSAETTTRRSTIGTAYYMAPEQATNANSVDQRADIFSLGVTFYKMFTRTLPQMPVSEWPPVSHRNPLLPVALDSILKKATNIYPDQRFATVEDFCNAVVQAFVDHEEGRSASTSALLESSSLMFKSAFLKETNRAVLATSPTPFPNDAPIPPSQADVQGRLEETSRNLNKLSMLQDSLSSSSSALSTGFGVSPRPASGPAPAPADSPTPKPEPAATPTKPAPQANRESSGTGSVVGLWIALVLVLLLSMGIIAYLLIQQQQR